MHIDTVTNSISKVCRSVVVLTFLSRISKESFNHDYVFNYWSAIITKELNMYFIISPEMK